MKQTAFKVSAKTARLIGRENINDADGAITELVKNSYDADASIVYVIFDIPFPEVPKVINLVEYQTYLSDIKLETILKFYKRTENNFVLLDIDEKEEDVLFAILSVKNRIVLFDNGCGMNENVLTTKWMNIGTNDKEINKLSYGGRIKTGAKGIGRFALDKLSVVSKVYTQMYGEVQYEWEMSWKAFDNANFLSEVNAEYDVVNQTYRETVAKIVKEYQLPVSILEEYSWNSGTMIVLNPTRERWNSRTFKKINKGFDNVNPFGSIDVFDIYVKNTQSSSLNYEKIKEDIGMNSYDYHVVAEFDGENTILINLGRNEIDLSKNEAMVEFSALHKESISLESFWSRKAFNDSNYVVDSLNSTMVIKKKIKELIEDSFQGKRMNSSDKDRKEMMLANYDKIGPFKFDFYYIKRVNPDGDLTKRINASNRSNLLKKFSGIKIYRDNFKVRPYGEEDTPLYDWLNLGIRAINSPAAATHHTGRWRISPNQIIGTVQITREDNPFLDDQANRESIAGDPFLVFCEILKCIISEFEYDRQYPLREFGDWRRELIREYTNKMQEEEILKRALEMETNADEEKEDEEQQSNKNEKSKEFARGVVGVLEDIKRLRDENAIYRAMSTSTMIVNTFTHEIKDMEARIHSFPEAIEVCVEELMGKIGFSVNERDNPITYLDGLRTTHQLLDSWIDIIMKTTKNSMENVEKMPLVLEIQDILDIWKPFLERDKIDVIFDFQFENESKEIVLNKGDLYLIVNNFILNSVWFLNKGCKSKQKEIFISANFMGDVLKIVFRNNGPRLDDDYQRNPSKIFELGESKKILSGGERGTGIGMWLVKEAVENNKGEISAVPFLMDGFQINVEFKDVEGN